MEMKQEVMTQKEKKLNIKVFVAKLLGYIFFGFAIPFAFLVWRFQLFRQTSKLNIGGWGIVAIIFAAVFFIKLIKQTYDCVDSVFFKQVLQAVGKVLVPLLAATLCIYAVGDFWNELLNFFITLTICEPIAYILNPFPEYLKEKEDSSQENKMTKIIELFWEKKK